MEGREHPRGENGTHQAQHRTRPSESPLSDWPGLQRGVGAHRWGCFLRAETVHSFYTYLEENPSLRGDVPFREMSHGHPGGRGVRAPPGRLGGP